MSLPSKLGASVLLFGCLFALPAKADDADAKKSAAIRAKMQEFVDRGDIAGAVTVVGRRDGTLSIDAVGSKNIEEKMPMQKDALFRIASMTKPITALGIMILVDEGKLAVDDPLEKHLPEFKGQMLVAERGKDTVTLKKPARPITIRDLMTHTSGLPGGMPEGVRNLGPKRTLTLAEAMMAYSQRPLEFEPGSKWSYCNPGIDTLARVIEVASGQSFEAFLKKRIFEPLEMTDTTFYPTEKQLERVTPLYDKKDGKLVRPPSPTVVLPKGARYPSAAGGLFSTGADLAKLYRMMLNGGTVNGLTIISPASLKAMTQVYTGDLKAGFTPGMGWGLGVGVVKTPIGVTEMLSPGSYGHGGAFGTQAWIDPEKDLFMVLLIQRVGLPNSDESAIRKEFQAAAVAAWKK